jgi:hypothetical protein
MPNHDGTGPLGQGPMSGRRRGFCGNKQNNSVIPQENISNDTPSGAGKGGTPKGCGNGFHFGGSRGRSNIIGKQL